METFSAALPIVAIVELATKAGNVVNGFCREYREAPKEVQHLAEQLNLIQSTLDSISHLHDRNVLHSLQLPESLQTSLHRALTHAKSTISHTHQQCTAMRMKYSNTIKGRSAWASSDHRKVLGLLQQLKDTQASLSVILSLLQPVFQILNQVEGAQIKALLNEIVTQQSLVSEYIQQQQQQKVITEAAQPRHTFTRQQFPQQFTRILSLPEQWRKSYGADLNLSKADLDKLVSCYLFILQLQFPSITGWKMLRSVFAISVGSPWYSKLSSRWQLQIDNIVPDDAHSVQACKEGNVPILEALFSAGRASIKDVTQDSRPLLWKYAINSGSAETVQFLLEKNADATVITGPYHTELLSRAFYNRSIPISRLLIQHHVDIQHINSEGLTPVANLFNPGLTEPASRELLDMLLCHGFSNLNVQDKAGFTALHRAAAYGTVEDIQNLVRYGADLTLKSTKHLWTPIFFAARYNNVEAFQALLKLENEKSNDSGSGPVVCQLDLEGWTLLHVAACYGSFGVIPLLLQAGANPHALSIAATNEELCGEVASRPLTPMDLVIAHHGAEDVKRFDEELKKSGFVTSYTEGEIFWDVL